MLGSINTHTVKYTLNFKETEKLLKHVPEDESSWKHQGYPLGLFPSYVSHHKQPLLVQLASVDPGSGWQSSLAFSGIVLGHCEAE